MILSPTDCTDNTDLLFSLFDSLFDYVKIALRMTQITFGVLC